MTDNLGPTLVAYMANTRDRHDVARWADGTADPDDATRARLYLASETWVDIWNSDGPDTARAWFIGANPRLVGDTPASRIREDDHEAVRAAVAAFIADGGGA